jgi:hypothetical protein
VTARDPYQSDPYQSDPYESDPSEDYTLAVRLSAADIERLRPWAMHARLSVGQLAGTWVLERLDAETALELRRADEEPPT